MPSRTLFPGPLAGSLTRGVFAWSGNSGRMTRLVVVHGEGADRAPLREVFFVVSTGASKGRHSRQIRPSRFPAEPLPPHCVPVLRVPLHRRAEQSVRRTQDALDFPCTGIIVRCPSTDLSAEPRSSAVLRVRFTEVSHSLRAPPAEPCGKPAVQTSGAVIILLRGRQPKFRPRGGCVGVGSSFDLHHPLFSERVRGSLPAVGVGYQAELHGCFAFAIGIPPFRGTCSRTLGASLPSLAPSLARRRSGRREWAPVPRSRRRVPPSREFLSSNSRTSGETRKRLRRPCAQSSHSLRDAVLTLCQTAPKYSLASFEHFRCGVSLPGVEPESFDSVQRRSS